MTAFSFTRNYLRKISPFLVLLGVLLVLSAVLNIFFEWGGIDLILRVYVYALSFLLIYSSHSINRDNYINSYSKRYGEHYGIFVFTAESRIIPFFIIYLIVILFGLASNINSPDWPLGVLVKFFEGKYTNLMMYCLFLSLIIRYQRNPLAAAGFFIASLISFYWVDYFFQTNLSYGMGYSAYKLVKLMFFFFFVLWDFDIRVTRLLLRVAVSFVMGCAVYVLSAGYIYGKYRFESAQSVGKRESGIILARMGMPVALDYLTVDCFSRKDSDGIVMLEKYYSAYKRKIPLSETEWELLMFSGKMKDSEKIAQICFRKKINVSYKGLLDHAYLSSMGGNQPLSGLPNYSLLTARLTAGHEEELMEKIVSSGREFTIWGIQILGLIDSEKSILFLSRYLSHVDYSISSMSYAALKNITGKDPAREMNQSINSPDVIKTFKDVYLYRGKDFE